jgi:hypothetical protein
MNRHHNLTPPELEDRLIEWSRFYRDRHRFTKCASIEGNFNPHAPGAWDSGWGELGAPTAPLPAIDVLRAIQTNEALISLGGDSTGKVYKWAITYHYCFAGLERWRILKAIRKYSGRRLNWKQYGEALDIARIRVWTLLNTVQAY